MKNIIIMAAVIAALSVGVASADEVGTKVPVNQFNREANMEFAGAKVSVIASSATSTHYKTHCSGKCLVYGIVVTSATLDGTYVILTDTTATNGTGTQYLPQFDIARGSVTYTIAIDPPARFNIGVTSIQTIAAGGPKGVSLLYLER